MLGLVAVVMFKLKVNIFFTERYYSCGKDSLTVADSTASHVTCGTLSASSPRVYSHGNVSFHFKTDGSGDARGFMLTYKLYTYNPAIGKYSQWKPLVEFETLLPFFYFIL